MVAFLITMTVLCSAGTGASIVGFLMNKKLEVLQENLETLLLDKTEAYTRGLNYGLSSKIVPNWNEHTRLDDRLWPPA